MSDALNRDAISRLEREHAALTEAFNQAWSDRDCERLLGYLHDDVAYLVYDDGPVFRGPAEIATRVGPFMAKFARIEFEILRMTVIGPAVIHERTEHYYDADGKVDTFFHVVGVLVMRDGKIVMWRDYAIPGARQIVGPLCRKK
jgi:limonene-1,2-epoxide hydrolase